MKTTLLLFILTLSSCSYHASEKSVSWHKGEGAEKYSSALLELYSNDWKEIGQSQFAGYQIAFHSQVLKERDIEESYSKIVEIENTREPYILSAQFYKKGLLPLFSSRESAPAVKEKFFSRYPEYQTVKMESFDAVVGTNKQQLVPLWRGRFMQNSQLWEILLTNSLHIVSIKRLGSHLDVQASVFPKGYKRSELTQVMLPEIYEADRLSSARVLVVSEVPHSSLNVHNPLIFSPQDLNFDQVQAYFNLDSSLRWFEEKFGYKPYQKIEAIVHLGYPEKTNAAFYYGGKIRVGTGDGVSYSHLAQDPSILIHESAHSVIEAVARLPFDGEGGSLNEGFADFFACVQLGSPFVGENAYLKGPFKRNISELVRLEQKNGGLYHDSLILSGLLWAYYKELGEKASLKIASKLLVEMSPLSDFSELKTLLPKVLYDVLEPVELKKALRISRERGFP